MTIQTIKRTDFTIEVRYIEQEYRLYISLPIIIHRQRQYVRHIDHSTWFTEMVDYENKPIRFTDERNAVDFANKFRFDI